MQDMIKSDLYGSIWLVLDHYKSNPTKSDLVRFILLVGKSKR